MAVALLAACSDKDPLGEGPDNGIGNPGENIGDGYVAVQINLPTNVVSAAPVPPTTTSTTVHPTSIA